MEPQTDSDPGALPPPARTQPPPATPQPPRRLVRRRDDRLLGGVCSGIADHLGIDPVVVRIAFVVLSFMGGAGLLAYAAGWLLIPEDGDERSIGERALKERRWAPIVGVVLIGGAVLSLADSWWWAGRGVGFPILLIAGGAYLLWTRTTPTPTPTGVRYGDIDPPTHASSSAGSAGSAGRPDRPPRRRRRRSRLGPIVLGLLFVGAGIVGLVIASGRAVQPSAVFAGGLMIVGSGLVAGTWVGRAWGLIPLGLLLLAALSASSVIKVPFEGGVGERHFTPRTASEVRDEYHLAMGELRLDLSALQLDRGQVRDITATVGAGHLDVTVPRGFDVEIHGEAGMGDVALLGNNHHDGGISIDRDESIKAGSEGAPKIVLDAEVGIGQVEVHRAEA
jgi:phage shock protein PspC (stress-responsive transcriptional regulator)